MITATILLSRMIDPEGSLGSLRREMVSIPRVGEYVQFDDEHESRPYCGHVQSVAHFCIMDRVPNVVVTLK